MTARLRTWIALAALALVCLQPARSAAQDRPTRAQRKAARVHFEAAEKAKAQGNYAAAARDYLAAYDDFAHPEFLYNAGEVLRLAGDRDGALEQLRRYVALDPQGRGAAAARTSIAELEAAMAAEREEAERRAREEEAARAAARAAPPAAPPAAVRAPVEPAPRPGRRLRIAGIATAGAGAVGLGLGVYFGLHARSLADQASRADAYDPDLDDRGESAERAMLISAGVGAAAVATGALLYVLGRRAGPDERPALTLVPWLAPSSIALGASVRF
jgi:tetratricopeptide (TPR) repeat protein